MNTVEKYEHSLVVGWYRFARANKVYSLKKSVHKLNIQEQTVTFYRPHIWFIYMQGTHECVIQHANLVKNGTHMQH